MLHPIALVNSMTILVHLHPTDSLVSKVGIIAVAKAGDMRFTDTLDNEKERGIMIKSTAISMYFEMEKEDVKIIKQKTEGNEFLINFISSLGHVDFLSKVTTSLCVCVQTWTLLHQALMEHIKPIVIINKVDCALLELQVSKEDLYQLYHRTIETANVIVSTYHDTALGDVQVYPDRGTVQASMDGLPPSASSQTLAKLWGDNCFNPATHKWGTKNSNAKGKPLERSFNVFVLEPIFKIFMNFKDQISHVCEKLDIKLTSDEQDLEGKVLLKVITHKFLPAGFNPPSPHPCHLNAAVPWMTSLPLVSGAMVPTSDKGRIQLYVLRYRHIVPAPRFLSSPDYYPAHGAHDGPGSNICGLVGINQFLLKSGTVTLRLHAT
ncbi:P-loop containing nucleoside triphosphate hydrolase protein [Suillus subluteus]|nr:P-loop containing nucleoside triphosphate hydrolase protein [Suillus subluteus]